jgi:hypothetical protein
MIDAAGTAYGVERIRLANQDGGGDRAMFTAFSGTRQHLVVTFGNVGLATTSITRLTISAVMPFANDWRSAPMMFREVPIQDAQGSAPAAPGVPPAPPGSTETDQWRMTMKSCARVDADLECALTVTNLNDRIRSISLGLDNGGTVAIDDDGNRYAGMSVAAKPQAVSPNSDKPEFKPYEERTVNFRFQNVPRAITTLPRVDVNASGVIAGGSPTKIPARYLQVPIFPPRG